jgi:HEAT repeat protein
VTDPVEAAEERQARSLLQDDGPGTDPEALRAALDSPRAILRGAAARLLGAEGDDDAREALERVATTRGEESARAQAAYALARLGDPACADVLRELLELPVDTSPGPLQAAGHLARLDDPSGLPVVERGLADAEPLIATIAAKQLAPLALLQERRPDLGVDAWRLYERALEHPDEQVSREARAQLERLDGDAARGLLEAHPA